jgi:AcrR family transcriptional regulator
MRATKPLRTEPGRAARPRKRRRSGRPGHTQNAVGRDAIIAATRELLKIKPPAEVSQIDIARFAGIDSSLIRYYFGTKDALLTAVAAEISTEMHSRIRDAIAGSRDSREQLANRIQAFLAMHAENPHLNHLILQYIVGSTEREAVRARSHMVSDSVAMLKEILDSGEQRGELKSCDARLLHIALIGMCDFFFTGSPVLHEIYGKKAADPQLVKQYGAFISRLIMEGLAAPGRQPR